VLAAGLSSITGAWVDAAIVLVIVGASVGIGFAREYAAQSAAAALERGLRTHTSVIRQGRLAPLPADELVPGDIVQLDGGSLVPGDGVVLEALRPGARG
jgi:magnesium-transporting ATPase (P-type)